MNKKAVIDLVLEEFNDSVIRYGVRNNTDYTTLEILLNIIYDKLITINYDDDINCYSRLFYILLSYIIETLKCQLNKKSRNVCIKNRDFIKNINYFTNYNVSKKEVEDILNMYIGDILNMYKDTLNRLSRGKKMAIPISIARTCNIPLRNTINKINAFCVINCIDNRVSDYELKLIIREFGHCIHRIDYEDIFLDIFCSYVHDKKCIMIQDVYNIINCYFIANGLSNEMFIRLCGSIDKKREEYRKRNTIVYLERVR